MSSLRPRAEPRADDRPSLDAEIRRFGKSYRHRLRKLARSTRGFDDLIVAHPAAAFVLASGRLPNGARAEALRLLKTGASLKAVGRVLDLPQWIRALPAEAFVRPLPLAALRFDDVAFGAQVANHIPGGPELAPMWLDWVLEARLACDDAFAAWIAGRKDLFRSDGPPAETLAPLAAYAWASQARGGAAETSVLVAALRNGRRWRPNIAFHTAVGEAAQWAWRALAHQQRRRDAALAGGPGRNGGRDAARRSGRGSWTATEIVGGYTVAPLRTAFELRAEGLRMRHCVGLYATLVRRGECLIYSVRRGDLPVATLEIRADAERPGHGRIAQLSGPRNEDVRPEIRKAAEAWLRRRARCPLERPGASGLREEVDEGGWAEVWRPYWTAKGPRGPLREGAGGPRLFALSRTIDRLQAL